MCGIVAAAAGNNIVPVLVEGLKKLEYRGYDSAGLAVIESGSIARVRSVGRVAELETASANTESVTGIAHTRWATHGVPSERNAHPHVSGTIAVVHNGIIENYESLRSELTAQGYIFTSDTDTESIAHLIQATLKAEPDLFKAVQLASQRPALLPATPQPRPVGRYPVVYINRRALPVRLPPSLSASGDRRRAAPPVWGSSTAYPARRPHRPVR